MNENEHNAFERSQQAVERILKIAANEQYDIYADGNGPLSLDHLNPALLEEEDFLATVEEWGWPDAADAAIAPAHEYHSAKNFVTALRHSAHPQYLNNFNILLRATPTTTVDLQNMSNLYGLYPVVHRANALAPDLMAAIRELFQQDTPGAGHGRIDTILAENEVVAAQVWQAFKIMGRLVKVDDYTMTLRRIVPDREPIPITDVQTYFYT